MDFIYSLAQDQVWKTDHMDGLDVYKTYFITEGGFTSAFIIAISAAAIMAIVYYLVIGFVTKRMSTMLVWIVMFALSLAGSFIVTDLNTGMGSNGKSGISKTLETKWKEVSQDGDDEYESVYQNMKTDFRKGLVKATPVMKVCLTNLVITALFYYILSVVFCLVLPASNYAKNHPHQLKK